MDSKRNGEELVQIFVDADACPVVAMALRKGAYAIHQSGKWYTNDKNVKQGLLLFLYFLFFLDSSSLFRFKIFNLLLDFIRAWDFGNTEILKLFF